MPVIVDASIRGKVKFPTMPNVVSRNDSIKKVPSPSGVSKMTNQNMDKIESSRGRPHLGSSSSDLRSTMNAKNAAATRAVSGLSESSKGVYVSSVG